MKSSLKRLKIIVINNLLLYFLIVTIISGSFYACTCNRNKTSEKKEIRAKIEAITKIRRFEKDLFSINIDSVPKYVSSLQSGYGEFFDLFTYKIVQLGSPQNPQYPDELKRFITDEYMDSDYRFTSKMYNNIDDIQKGLTDAFCKYKDYFPNKKIPHIYTCISGWNQSVITSDTILAIALDKYLGHDCYFYKKLELDLYARYTMERAYILPDCMRDWGYTEFERKDSVADVLSNMLYEGKILYFVNKMLPGINDTLLFGYTPSQLTWCKNNKTQMWTYLVEHKLLFSTELLDIRKLVYPAPFTNAFTKESPGRAAVWLGYNIVDAYMNNNKNITLPELMNELDYQKVLRESDFKP
jgi:hypothetical protein